MSRAGPWQPAAPSPLPSGNRALQIPPGLLLVLLSCLPAPGQLLDMVGPGSTAQETGRMFGNVQGIVVFRMDSWQGCRGSGPLQGKRGKDQGQG
jgi:hypothetical protein